MSTAEMTCRQCKAAMALHPIDPVCGEDGPLKVTLIRMPAMVCPNTHRRFAMPRFPLMLLERVSQQHIDTLPEGKKSGLLFKKYQCGDCGADLEKGAGRDETFDFDVTLESLPGFRVELTAPLYKCTACGKEQLRGRDEIRQSLPAAMALAFKAANLKPE
jgi:DNA-directed RNA polymerase subunit RPC12/RpoP